jgi:hypothetical protein
MGDSLNNATEPKTTAKKLEQESVVYEYPSENEAFTTVRSLLSGRSVARADGGFQWKNFVFRVARKG